MVNAIDYWWKKHTRVLNLVNLRIKECENYLDKCNNHYPSEDEEFTELQKKHIMYQCTKQEGELKAYLRIKKELEQKSAPCLKQESDR